MKILFLVLCLFVLKLLCVPSEASRGTNTNKYLRFKEVERECGSYLSSSTELKPDDSRWYTIKNVLSFNNGDWGQQSEVASLMPFGENLSNISRSAPLKLASFSVTNIDSDRHSEDMINVTGTLYLSIGREPQYFGNSFPAAPYSQIFPGNSLISIFVEGVYFETENNGGSRMLCMLGTADLPLRQSDEKNHSVKKVKHKSSASVDFFQHPLVRDGNILVILNFPKIFSLTSREIQGEMTSLNGDSNKLFFNKVHISSQLGAHSSYRFGSHTLVSRACNQDAKAKGLVEAYKGLDSCNVLQLFMPSGSYFVVMPNWKCNLTNNNNTKLGPFAISEDINTTISMYQSFKMIMQVVKCERGIDVNDAIMVRVSAVFRALTESENQYLAEQRTGLNDATLSAEGIWSPSSGQLCMVGCLGRHFNEVSNNCSHRVCLYASSTFSITQRSLIFGTISDIRASTDSYALLPVGLLTSSFQINDQTDRHIYYRYTKIESAGAFSKRSQSFYVGTIVMKPLLSYPKPEGFNELYSLSSLANDLSFDARVMSGAIDKIWPQSSKMAVGNFQVLSLNSMVGRYWMSYAPTSDSMPSDVSSSDVPLQNEINRTSATEHQLLNVSAELFFYNGPYATTITRLLLEGLYDPVVGKMYLIGCRDVPFPLNGMCESMELEDGLDCLIEVKVEYPPTTARWLVNPTAMISITSQRNVGDPLHFSSVQLVSGPLMYQKQIREALSRRDLEGILRILTLSFAAACIFSQLFYIEDNVNAVPFISLAMLGVQALGYSLPLIIGVDAIFARRESEAYETSYLVDMNLHSKVINYFGKLLVLAVFLLTLRLFQKVWKSRIRLLTRTPLEPGRVPSEKMVLLITLIFHSVGLLVVLLVHSIHARMRPVVDFVTSQKNNRKLSEWTSELEEYVGLVQDFFLLPQVIGNFLWQINRKPLKKVYYMGVTLVRLLPHLYDYVRPPMLNPYFDNGSAFVNPYLNFYSKFGDVAILVLATVFACIVYIQQSWSYEKLSQRLNYGQRKLLPLGSRVYERLPSRSFEAELVSSVNEVAAQGELRNNEQDHA